MSRRNKYGSKTIPCLKEGKMLRKEEKILEPRLSNLVVFSMPLSIWVDGIAA